MNNKQSSWESEKKKLAEKIKEMTLIWKISYEERNRLISIGINTWDNLYLIKNLYEFRKSDTKYVQEKIIHMNKHNELLIEPRNISQDFKNILQKDSIEFVLDIESVINLEEKGNYFYNKSQNELPNICIIGLIIISNDKYLFKDFTIDDLTCDVKALEKPQKKNHGTIKVNL